MPKIERQKFASRKRLRNGTLNGVASLCQRFRSGPGIHFVEWRATLQIHQGDFVHGELRVSGGSGPLFAKADRRWRTGVAMRMADRQVRALVTDCAYDVVNVARGARQGKGKTSDGSDA